MNLSDKGNHVSRVKTEYQLTGTYEAGAYSEGHMNLKIQYASPFENTGSRKGIRKINKVKIVILLFGMTPT